MKWPEGQGGGAEVRNGFTITDPRGDRAVKRAELALLSKRNSECCPSRNPIKIAYLSIKMTEPTKDLSQ